MVTSQATMSSMSLERGRRAHGLVGAHPAVGRGGAAAADDDAPGPRVAGGEEQLAHAGGVGTHRVVTPGPREQGTPRGTGHLNDGGQRSAGHRPAEEAPLGLDAGAQRACDDGVAAGPAEGLQEAFAPVRHGNLVGCPPGRPGSVPHGRGHVPGRCGPPELVRSGDQMGHADEATG